MGDATAARGTEGLKRIPIFAGLDDDALGRILACAAEVDVPAGQVLAEAKLPGAGLFIVEEGSVVVEIPGHPVELGPGEFFGELSLLTDAPRSARVQAKTPVRCLAIARADVERLLNQEPTMALAMLRALAHRLVELETH